MTVTSTAAELVVRQLRHLGAELAFGVPGESYLAVLDAMRGSGFRFVTCRQEGGAGYAAEAHAKLTGRPGVLMVTRGPGATNAAVAIHTAQQDETPLIVLVGLVPAAHRGRDAFQEFDLGSVFGSMAKSVTTLDQAHRAPEVVARAWSLATAGRPGPVVIGLPEDVLEHTASAELVDPSAERRSAPEQSAVDAIRTELAAARRPLVVVGGSRWTERAVELLPTALAGLPLVTAFRRQDLVDHRGSCFAGSLGLGADPSLVQRVRDADVVLVVGDRLDDPTSNGFELFAPGRAGRLLHVHPDPHELGRVHRADIAAVASPESFLELVAEAPIDLHPDARRWATDARAAYAGWAAGGGVQEAIARGLRELLAPDAIVTHGAGNFTRPVQRSYTYHRPGRQLAPISGSMGYGLPAALAASITYPDRQVVCVAGDGDLMMTVQELATAAHVGASLTVLVVNNSAYGTIRTHQERRYPGREIATGLTNPDFVQLGRAFGATAVRVATAADALDALGAAVSTRGLQLVELVT